MTENKSRNILLKIAYDGTDFHGWQKQPEVRTVQGEIEHVLCFISGKEISINGTSRTDAGVHSLGQCASFTWDLPLPTEKLADIMNRRFCAGGPERRGFARDIKIISAKEMDKDFHARFSCHGKTYKYIIDRSGDIFKRNYVYHYPYKLDYGNMKRAAKAIEGTHDFACFQTSGGIPRETTVRTVTNIDVKDDGSYTIIRVTGDGFLYNMVRIIVGTLLEVGINKRAVCSVGEAIDSCDRSMAGFTAPPQGLYLEQIYFDDDFKSGGNFCIK